MSKIPLINPQLTKPQVTSNAQPSAQKNINSDSSAREQKAPPLEQTPEKKPASAPSSAEKNHSSESNKTAQQNQNEPVENKQTNKADVKTDSNITDKSQSKNDVFIATVKASHNNKDQSQVTLELKVGKQSLKIESPQDFPVGSKLILQSQKESGQIKITVLAVINNQGVASANPKTSAEPLNDGQLIKQALALNTQQNQKQSATQTLLNTALRSSGQALSNTATTSALDNLSSNQSLNNSAQLNKINQAYQQNTAPTKQHTPPAKVLTDLINNRLPDLPNNLQQQVGRINQQLTQGVGAPASTPNTSANISASTTVHTASDAIKSAPANNLTSTAKTSSDTPLQAVKEWQQQLPTKTDLLNDKAWPKLIQQSGTRLESQLLQLATQSRLQQLSQNDGSALKLSPSQESSSNSNQIFKVLQSLWTKGSSTSTQTSATAKPLSTLNNTGNALNNTANTSAKAAISLQQTLQQTEDLLAQQFNSASLEAKSGLITQLQQDNKGMLGQILLSWLKPSQLNAKGKTDSSNSERSSSVKNATSTKGSLLPSQWQEQQLKQSQQQTLFNSLKTMFSHIEAEQVQQLSDNQNQHWLPIFYQEKSQLKLLEVEIEQQDKKKSSNQVRAWHIKLHVELSELGQIGIELSLAEQQLSSTFWSSRGDVLQQLQQQLAPLRKSLQDKGFIVQEVKVQRGELAKKSFNFQQHLIDVKT